METRRAPASSLAKQCSRLSLSFPSIVPNLSQAAQDPRNSFRPMQASRRAQAAQNPLAQDRQEKSQLPRAAPRWLLIHMLPDICAELPPRQCRLQSASTLHRTALQSRLPSSQLAGDSCDSRRSHARPLLLAAPLWPHQVRLLLPRRPPSCRAASSRRNRSETERIPSRAPRPSTPNSFSLAFHGVFHLPAEPLRTARKDKTPKPPVRFARRACLGVLPRICAPGRTTSKRRL